MINLIIAQLQAYFLGAFPTSVWLGKLLYNVDVRKHGSRNAGATNTFRVLGKPLGWTVLLLDVGKGFLAVSLVKVVLGEVSDLLLWQILAGVLAVLGHIYSIFTGFKGGKGVATALGVNLCLCLYPVLLSLGVFLIVFISTRYVSLSSIIASCVFPLALYAISPNSEMLLFGFSLFVPMVVLYTHRMNVKRLINGNEPKMNLIKSKA
ncbi:MAG: acyl-phosphate glycerol 3-phosphate acyltransferase [Bacteroidota bacterium]|jgi:glycerol-3-phosphate acyltransferase PlsY